MPTVAPGEGERRAIGGYHPQYRASASLILRNLRHGRLEWIRVADPEAGRVDDLQIGSSGRVDAYQVKSAQYGGTFTFRDLAEPQTGVPALIQQLARGWMTLRQKYPQSRVVVHLVTNQIASSASNAALPTGEPPPRQSICGFRRAGLEARPSYLAGCCSEHSCDVASDLERSAASQRST